MSEVKPRGAQVFWLRNQLRTCQHRRQSERQILQIERVLHSNVRSLQCISEDILIIKQDFDLKWIAQLCWLKGIDNDHEFSTRAISGKEVPLFTLDFDASRWGPTVNITKINPKLRRISKPISSNTSCIGHKYVCVYEVGWRIVALKNWYLYFLPDIPGTKLQRPIADRNLGSARRSGLGHDCPMSETLWNLLDSFTSSWPMTRPGGEHTGKVYMHEASKEVRIWNGLGILCVTQVFTALK